MSNYVKSAIIADLKCTTEIANLRSCWWLLIDVWTVKAFLFDRDIITARVCGKVMFSYCLSVCLSVCSSYNIIQVKFEYQGHWVTVTLVKWACWTVGNQILLALPTYGSSMVIKVILRSRSSPDQFHSRVIL